MQTMPILISKAKLAELAGVSKAAVTKACKAALLPAVVGSKINFDNSVIREYLAKHLGIGVEEVATIRAELGETNPKVIEKPSIVKKSAKKVAKKAVRKKAAKKVTKKVKKAALPAEPKIKRKKGDPVTPDWSMADIIECYGEMTLREVVTMFGTAEQLKDYTASVKTIESIRENRAKNAKLEGSLISREFVADHILGMIDSGNVKLLQDSSKTIYNTIRAHVSAGGSDHDGILRVRDILSSQIKGNKERAIRLLKNG